MDFLQKYGIEIKNKKLLLIALTHSSYANEKHLEHYERLEYLGDAVLQLIISEYLYNEKDLKEGKKINVNNYIEKEKNYNNKVSTYTLKLSNLIDKCINKSLKLVLKYLENSNI